MSKVRSFGTVQGTVLWCSAVVCVTVSLADANTLRQSSHHGLRGVVSAKESEVHRNAGCGCPGPSPAPPALGCPCLDTPTGYVIQEQLQASQMLLAADSAMAQGITAIGLAGTFGGRIVQDYNASSIQTGARKSFDLAEKNTTARLEHLMGQEAQREGVMDNALQARAREDIVSHAAHLRATAQDWAKNQALNYMAETAGGGLKEAVIDSESIPELRQRATEQTKGAIEASAEALKVAQKAQYVVSTVPKEQLEHAADMGKELRTEMEALHLNIQRAEGTTARVAEESHEAYVLAQVVLKKAMQDAIDAKAAYEKTQANAGKIQTLKAQAQTVSEEAKSLVHSHGEIT